MTSPTDATALADRFIASWNAVDPEDRRDLVAGTWTEDAVFVDPMMQGQGHDGIEALVAGVQSRFPGFRFNRIGVVDAHNGRMRFAWAMGPEGGESVVEGLDFGVIADDGRLKSITGFFDKLPG
jgi:hypothetical protein